ncbi:MAG: hypothetical protein JSW34_09185 [Candidatus Zixiibacteriota bacterium]|nr:MAG: hypothetical protein JSW34_09185 [candidate division Zixibacteria bacterium]
MKKLIVPGALLVLLISGAALARGMEDVKETVDIQGASEVVVRCDLGAGEFSIVPRDMAEAAVIDISYDPDRIEYHVNSEVRRDRCYVELESEHRRSHDIDTEDNVWDVALSTRYPVSLEMDMGACDAEFELGGLRLKELALDIGAASGKLTFSKPNPIRASEIDIDAGASSLETELLGNANFDYFNFDGGVGSFDLDFRGEYDGESEVSIDIGLGSVDIILPSDLPVRIETDGTNWLSSVDLHNDDLDRVDDDVYESEDFERATTRMTIKLSVGLGSVDIYCK